jgi:hypothetical protein
MDDAREEAGHDVGGERSFGIGVAITGFVLVAVDGLFGADWERRYIDEYLQRRGVEPGP